MRYQNKPKDKDQLRKMRRMTYMKKLSFIVTMAVILLITFGSNPTKAGEIDLLIEKLVEKKSSPALMQKN